MSPVRIRPARPDDHAAYARLLPELGVDDPVPPVERWEQTQRPTTLIAEQDGAVVGYAFYVLFAGAGHLRNIVVDRAARGAGIGRLLMDAVADRLRAAGATAWTLNVKPDNTAAIRLYESFGMTPEYPAVVLRLGWDHAAALAAVTGVVAAPVEPAQDTAVEAAMSLAPGRIAEARRGGNPIVQLREDGAVVGVTVFVPEVPGAFPFRLARPELAGSLLAALRPHARPEHDHLLVGVENDDPLASALSAAGAIERMRVVYYRGPL